MKAEWAGIQIPMRPVIEAARPVRSVEVRFPDEGGCVPVIGEVLSDRSVFYMEMRAVIPSRAVRRVLAAQH